MKYSDVINFNPIDSVIQLTAANDKSIAKNLVKSYVMSNEMAEKLKNSMLSQLKLEDVVDNKGVLLVGNYGTGKSHLMSIISAIALEEDNLNFLQNKKFANEAKCIAGRFEVLRIEIGASQMSLRNIIFNRIKQDFESRGLIFSFPDEKDIITNKDTMFGMLEEFSNKYSAKGYLIVVDEFLDYLGGRNSIDVKRDLGFLRELGEIIKSSKLRVIFGVQEKLFDNPNFSFVSETLSRVKDRFEQVIIRKEDTAYVVAERILKKTPEQKAAVREHLVPFISLYSNMSERLEEFVDLFPIHPSYIDVFNKIYIIENRHILKNISETIQRILDKDIDNESPGILSFDSYWMFIKENMALRTDANIKEVVEKSSVLEDIVTRSFPKKLYKPIAMQIIRALSVHRLTTGDISIRSGLTSENLRDDLCLYILGMPDQSSDTLQSIIQTILKDIMTTVSGQFIENNIENGQYYLDLKKDIDYDEKISQRAVVIDNDSLNNYFYDVVYYCLDWEQKEHVSNYKIYEHTINWVSHNIFRKGYLFLGTPENRPTAQPPEDYYIYFVPPYTNESFLDSRKLDEIFFVFKNNEDFKNTLRLYSASLIMKDLAEEKNKPAYQGKAELFRKKLTSFLSENKNTCFEIYYKGEKRQLLDVMKGHYKSSNPFKETIDLVSSIILDEWFDELYPEMPLFKLQISQRNLQEIIRNGIDRFSGRKNLQANALLESFGLLDGDIVSIQNSKYAVYFADKLNNIPQNSVLNFRDIYKEVFDGYTDKKFGINYMLMPIIFLGLVYSGNAVITLRSGTLLTASDLDGLPKISLSEIAEFKFISKPKGIRLAELVRLFEILGLPTGLINNPNQREAGLEQMLTKVQEELNKAIEANNKMSFDFELWGEPLIAEHIIREYKKAVENVRDTFSNFHIRFNTTAKINNFNYSLDQIEQLGKDLRILTIILDYDNFRKLCDDEIQYIMKIESIELSTDLKTLIHDAKNNFRQTRDQISIDLNSKLSARAILDSLSIIKSKYINYYFSEHQKSRLGLSDGKLKGTLINSNELSNLKRLKAIGILPASKLDKIENDLSSLKVCYELTAETLKSDYFCTKCNFILGSNEQPVAGKLSEIDDRLNLLLIEWTRTLFNTIEDPLLVDQMKYLTLDQQAVIDNFIRSKMLPEKIDNFFIGSIVALLQGFEPIIINAGNLIERLESFGPLDMETFKERIFDIFEEYSRSKDKEKLRIVVKK